MDHTFEGSHENRPDDLDSELVEAVDRAARRLGTTRSAFARQALREALKDVQLRVLEEKR